MVGPTIVELEGISGSITLGGPLINGKMIGDFPTLVPGMNAVNWSGNVTKIEAVQQEILALVAPCSFPIVECLI